MSRVLPAILLAALAGGCSTTESMLSRYPDLEEALYEFQGEQAKFVQQNAPKKYDFGEHGTVTVRDVTLDGYPGSAYVRCRFHYQNTSRRPVVRSLVSLDILDAAGRMVASKVAVLIVPAPIPIASGSFFADELRTRTMDAHLQPGWSWRITCKSEFEEPEGF